MAELPALVDRAGALVVAVEASAAQLGADVERQHALIQSEALRKRVGEQVRVIFIFIFFLPSKDVEVWLWLNLERGIGAKTTITVADILAPFLRSAVVLFVVSSANLV